MIQRKHNDSPLCYILGDSQQLLLNPITYLEEDACGGAADTLVKSFTHCPKGVHGGGVQLCDHSRLVLGWGVTIKPIPWHV